MAVGDGVGAVMLCLEGFLEAVHRDADTVKIQWQRRGKGFGIGELESSHTEASCESRCATQNQRHTVFLGNRNKRRGKIAESVIGKIFLADEEPVGLAAEEPR